jgi:hypothetical protein
VQRHVNTQRTVQRTSQKPAGTQKTFPATQRASPQEKRNAPPVRRVAPHPANTPLPANAPVKHVPPPSHPTNPYKEGTKKFLVAQRLIAGERDRKKIAREVGVSVDTTYTVVSDLRAHGYSIGASGNSKSAPPAPFSPAHQLTSNLPLVR